MAWTLMTIPGVGTIATIAGWATNVVNNFRYLKGLDGVPTIESGLIIDNTGGDEYVKLPLLSTAEAGTVLAAEGQIAHDETTHRIKLHDGTAVRSLVSTADVDDTPANGATTDPISSNWAYDHIATLTTRGDTIRRSATVWERLAIGTSGQYLSSNGTDVVWAAGTLTAGCIVIWAGTIANIPTGYVICDGNNSTPNLLTRFLEGVATAATNPGTTGGATSKTTTGHTHTFQSQEGYYDFPGTGSSPPGARITTVTDSITDIRPLFYDVAYIMKT